MLRVLGLWPIIGRTDSNQEITQMDISQREELFAQKVIEHEGNRSAALRDVLDTTGWDQKSVWQEASRWAKRPSVRARVEQLRTEIATTHRLHRDRIVAELCSLAFSNMRDYIQIDDNGDAWVDLSGLTYEQAAAIQELTHEEYTEGRGEAGRDVKRVKVKLYSKTDALEKLAKIMGYHVDKVDITSGGQPIQAADSATIAAAVAAVVKAL